MKNLNVISAGLKSLCSSEASAIIEELQTPEQIMCIDAVHIDDFGEESSCEYTWRIPEYLWLKISVNDQVIVENLDSTARVRVVQIIWLNIEEALQHMEVLYIDNCRFKNPFIYLDVMKPVFCWYQKELPKNEILYTSMQEVREVLIYAAKKNILSLYSFRLLTGACLEGCLEFLNEHAPFLGRQASLKLEEAGSWLQNMDECEFIYKPFSFTDNFMHKIQEAGYYIE